MIVVALDAGASKAGLAVLRVTRAKDGVHFDCVRHGHLDLMLDGGPREDLATSSLLSIADWARSIDPEVVFAVEGVEGYVFKGRSATHLFDTADQAGFIRATFRAWARMRAVPLQVQGVARMTARAVRGFMFGKDGARAGDNEVVLAIRASVSGMPPLRVPVPDSRSEEYKPMHAYDAAAVALVAAMRKLGKARLFLPDAALAEIAKYRIESERRKAEKEARAAVAAAGVKLPRRDSRHTRRRRSEAARAAAARRAP